VKRRFLLGSASALLAACATPPRPERDGWHDFPLPGKRRSQYRWVRKDGRDALEAVADRSASLWKRRVQVPAEQLGVVEFSWRADRLLSGASVQDVDSEDAVARVIFGFDGDHSRLSGRTRAQYELASLLTGETPPYATLMYVWDSHQPPLPLETVVTNPRSERIRKIVVDSGPEQLGRWREHRRDLRADFERAFGEAPGELLSVALMTDADNTGGRAQTWYGSVHWGS
jgi:hypothetical protein